MLRPAPRKVLRAVARVVLQIIFGIVLFAVLITAAAWGIHGVILVIAAIP